MKAWVSGSLEPFPADADALTSRVWEWGPADGPATAGHVCLLPDGRLAGRTRPRGETWRLEDGRLAFHDAFDLRSALFEEARVDERGRWVLSAHREAPGGAPHILRELPPVGQIASASLGVDPVRFRVGPRRRHLVVVRAGPRSLHNAWTRNIQDHNRSWDLCVSFYDREPRDLEDEWSEYRIVQNERRKYQALHELLHAGSSLWTYEYLAFPDDDLMLSWRDWNELFAICRRHRLDLAQPALSEASHVTHPITRRNPAYLLRYVSFIEVMAPVFSRAALRACAPTFQASISGFGLDNTWPKLIGEPRDRMAVIDQTPVVHTRPQGLAYSIEAAIAEGNALQDAYDSPSEVLEFGGLFAEPVNRQHAW